MKNILLVEDEAIIALAEKRTLEGFGYQVQIAYTGENAVDRVLNEEARADLILMDIDLKTGIDGTQAARRILAERNVPIVFLTSHSERDVVEKVRGITRYGYIIKNSGNFVLQSSIEMAFELFEAHERIRDSQAFFKTVINTIPDLVWLKDMEGRYLACNPVFERFAGVKEEKLLGKSDYDLFDRETANFFCDRDRMALKAGKPTSNEERITFPDTGETVFLETLKTPMMERSGRLVGVLGIGRNITERKTLEDALVESERKVQDKLTAITSPKGDIGNLELSEIVDIPTLASLLEDFSALTGMAVAILDTKGTILVATGWQDICTNFHRKNPKTASFCTESDLYLASHLAPGEYVDYKCRNGIWDVVTPLFIEGRYFGNIYSGQFFYDDDVVDRAYFEAQADTYGFDREAYLTALRRVPRFSRDRIRQLMDFLVRLTDYVSRLSLGNLRLARITTEKTSAEELLSNSLLEKDMLLKELQHRTKNSLGLVSSLLSLSMSELHDELATRKVQEAVDRIRSIAVLYEKLSASSSSGRIDLAAYLRDILALLDSTYASEQERVRIVQHLDEIPCSLRWAVTIGLLLNELITNAYKYAYPGERRGEIRVDLHSEGDDAFLTVSDDGVGIPGPIDLRDAKTLGLRIIRLLAQEIGGSLSFDTNRGVTASIRFPLRIMTAGLP